MKKTTVLIYVDATCPEKGLKVATQEEWSEINKKNRGLPMCKRRCFLEDRIEDGEILDRMFIEVPYAMYRDWHRASVQEDRKREEKKKFHVCSMEQTTVGAASVLVRDTIADAFDLEKLILESISLDMLRKRLKSWRPWANELLNAYIDGDKEDYVRALTEQGMVKAVAYRRMSEFDLFVRNYYETVWKYRPSCATEGVRV